GAAEGIAVLAFAQDVAQIELVDDHLVGAQRQRPAAAVERCPVWLVEHLRGTAADDISGDGELADALAEPERERIPPGRVQREQVGPMSRPHPLDELERRRHAVPRGTRERKALIAAEANDIERRQIRHVRDGASIPDEHPPRRGIEALDETPGAHVLITDVARRSTKKPNLLAVAGRLVDRE